MSHIDVNKAAKNSILLYLRVIISMVITLWVTRIVLKSLGVEDYGIYNVVAGFVVLFGVISSSLSAAISRYITFELGRANFDRLRQIFRTSIVIQVIIATIVIIVAETVGLWFLNYKMNIPLSNIISANWVYQFSVIAFAIDLISVPYNAIIIAHERMKIFAYVGISTSFAKLLVALSLSLFSNDTRLIWYAALLLIVSISIRIFYGIYCSRNFCETRGRVKLDLSLCKEVFGFAGWNFIGATAGIFKEQGVNIILNLFFGPIVNASRGIAVQVSAAATTFANSFMTAINPQITKSYASGEISGSLKLCLFGSRMGYFLMFILALPIIWDTPYILKIWLGEIPEYSVVFVRLILINALIDILSSTLMTLMLATGKIRNYQLIVGGCNLMILPVAYLVLCLHYPPQSALIVGIIMSCIALSLRLLLLRAMTKLSISEYFKDVIFRILTVSIFSIICVHLCTWLIVKNMTPITECIISSILCLISAVFGIYIFGLKRVEKNKVKNIIITRIQRK